MTDIDRTFTPIDQTTWPRREVFYYFTKLTPTGFSLTVDLDITATLQWTRAHHVSFNASYLYLVSRILTQHPEMRIGRLNDQLGTFDVLHPSYTVLHADHTMANLWTAYDPDFTVFHQRYQDDLAQYGDQAQLMPKPPLSPNLFTIGSLPWVHFTNYTPLPLTSLNTFFPIFQAGKFAQDAQGAWQLPLSITIHHAVADGYHVSALFNDLQAAFTQPDGYLN